MLCLVFPCEGSTSGDDDDPWRQPKSTWREEDRNGSYGGRLPRWQVEAIEVPVGRTPLMAPSIDKSKRYIPSSGFSGRHSLSRILERFASLWWEEPASEQLLALRPMEAMGSKTCTRSSAEGNSGRYRR